MKLGSLFDASGTAPLAATICGIEPVWASEIEPYPIKVTKARFPNMKHLGSILDINGAEVEPVDVLCGGSPCQDLSVAGKQKGIHNGERSHLFFEMTRIIKEMRNSTNGKYPRYVIWENVPGAFSSNGGYDFLAVLQAFAEIADPDVHVPEPVHRGKTERLAWRYAGSIVGDGYSIAWRTVDARYWGVPQRRRRIYLVADLGGRCAGEILFERESLSRDTQQGRTPRKKAAVHTGRGPDGSCGAISINRKQLGLDVGYDIASTLLAYDYKEAQVVIIGGFVGRQGAKSGSVGFELGISPTLRSGITTDVVYSVEGNTIDRESNKNGKGWSEDVSPTLNTQDRHGCVYAADIRNGAINEEISGTLQSKNGGGYSLNYQNPVVYQKGNCLNPWDIQSTRQYTIDGVYETLRAHQGGRQEGIVYPIITGPLMANSHPGSYTGQDAFSDMLPVHQSNIPTRKYIVRRLTPLECCRLQGFPDWWEDGVEGSDSARYKMWGNGMALPNMLYVMQGIASADRRTEP